MKILITGATGFVGRTLVVSVQSFIDRYLSVGKGQTESRKHVSWSLLENNCYDRGWMVQAGYRLFS